MGIVEVKDLSLALNGETILDDLTVDFWEGHIHAVVGPNGAGKSTFAYTLMGLAGYRHFDGDLMFQGQSIKDLGIDERARKGMTLGWQEPARYEGLSVAQFLQAAARRDDQAIVTDVLEKMGLDPQIYARRAVDATLSGGERKKIEMASILAMHAKFVMLDEPDSGIDVSSLQHIFQALKFLKDGGATVVLITHSLSVLEQADHAFLFCGGRIVDKGSIEKIRPYFEGNCLPCDHQNNPESEAKESNS
ncbi:ATP-binding cassette domain-containing protein [candidate division KSB3 bacterium]|uniref:ATP-binding cassette domain-containing protein n=1 Tax=candidate division KSB3 bacterium TaxID=2044937 RepID=A0A9D5Q7Y8_9BACT|nr:ATP-binding cassette domain-containing protein [candidate division KSB3 bacterium]MBD3327405.1 ATP-binding cassette domain-containing protein [candidate division KSB3 bacterium]